MTAGFVEQELTSTGTGTGVIAGEGTGIVTIDNVPGVALVDLFVRETNVWIRRTVSRYDGTYRFSGLPMDILYNVIARDLSDMWEDVIVGRVAPFVPVTITGNAPDASVGGAYSYPYEISGGQPPYAITLVGSLPSGLTLVTTETTASISGNAVIGASDSTFTIEVEDVRGAIASLTDTIRILVDEYADSVVSLLHFDGVDGSTTITDSKGKVWASTGAAALTTANARFGGSSLALASSGANYVESSHADFDFGTGDYTIEGFYKPDASSNRAFIKLGTRLIYVAANNWAYYNGSSNAIIGGSVSTTEFAHVALARHEGTTRLFVNGQQVGSNYTGETGAVNASPLRIGYFNSGNPSGGLYDEIRITKGVARYTADFTPPAVPFP